MDFETIIILSALLELVTLICFFVLCSNVSAIRKKLCKDDILSSSLIAMYMGLGEKSKAREALIEHIVSRLVDTDSPIWHIDKEGGVGVRERT